ncbi:hypothetical protein [Spiroplasma endosymbiont of Polydrusus pterygomalis]|uniref:hypothetical protein n=1 Tax=Spiroplasma endosymbiont of Polydrusus pterygomalis TaxID=3139327 RepID=UPI003CCB035A
MGKFHAIASSLWVFGTVNLAFIPTTNFVDSNGYIGLTNITSTSQDDFIYSGRILLEFIYKSSNISSNSTIREIEQNIIQNKDTIYNGWGKTCNVTINRKELFEMSLIGSIVNISGYGMESWKEFFAEAYAKWTTTPDAMKNKSWEILNEFFIDIYAPLQKNNFGSQISTLQKSLDFIDQYLASSKIIYDTNLAKKSSDAVNLKYSSNLFGSRFGLQQTIGEEESYTFNALKTALIMWQSNKNKDIKNSHFPILSSVIYQNIIANGWWDLSDELAKMMNDSYTKAQRSSRRKYEDFMSAAKQKNYASFDKLDQTLKNLTRYENNYYHRKGSTIFLKDSVQAVQDYYRWSDDEVRNFENQILDLFNITYAVTDNNFKYFLTGFIFSPYARLENQSERTAAYTSYSFENAIGTSNQIVTTRKANIVISTEGIDNTMRGRVSSQYNSGWWSAPNQFYILNHEMGHAVDAYYGMIKEARNNAQDYFKDILDNIGVRGQYSGNIFGYDDVSSYNQKVNLIKIILIVIFGVVCTSIIIAVIWGARRKMPPQNKKD